MFVKGTQVSLWCTTDKLLLNGFNGALYMQQLNLQQLNFIAINI